MDFLKGKKLSYGIEIFLIVFLIFASIFNHIITRQIIAIVLGIVTIIVTKFIKNGKTEDLNKLQLIAIMFMTAIMYITMLYIMGIYFGFYNSTVQLSLWSIENYIIPIVCIIVFAEIIRKKIILNNSSRTSLTLITTALVMLDVILMTDIKNLTSLEEFVTVLGFVVFSSIANNILYDYIILNFKTNKPIIIYRLITTLYVYIIPITPDIYAFFESIIRMVVPYIIYVVLDQLYNKHKKVKLATKTIKEVISTVITVIIVTIIVMFVSCKFTYGVLVIGSGSMTGTLNKGDIVVYKKYDNKEIKIGEIIVFDKSGTKTVHRVVNKKESSDKIKYYTKGDANLQKDLGYIESKDVIGRVMFRIPYMGYLNLWLADLFNIQR